MDTDALQEKMTQELAPAFTACHDCLCSPSGIDMVNGAIEKEGLTGCLFVACGKGTKDSAFDRDGNVLAHRVDLRELVGWAMEPGEEDTLMAAEDYVRMGHSALMTTKAPTPFILEQISEEILVLGGGVAGLTAAKICAAAGYEVHLVERNHHLGGWAVNHGKQIPFHEPFSELRDPEVDALLRQVNGNKRIHIYLQSEVGEVAGQPGDFTVSLKGRSEASLSVGSILVASGWRPFTPPAGDFFGYGAVPGVLTSVEFEEQLKTNQTGSAGDLLFIQCAGSRNPDHLPYCSSVCCGVTLKHAKLYRELHPDAVIYIVYKDIRTPGYLEEFYQEVQDDPHIIFLKGDVNSVRKAEHGVLVSLEEELSGEVVQLNANQVVLATGMVPNGREDLNLQYRQGAGIPDLKYDFPDSHFICFPYETRRTGIYAAGAVRAPMDIPSSIEDAGGAALKAIQTIEAAKRGEAVHPRSGDTTYPELYMERCTDCKRCTEECPFGTYNETESGTPIVHPNRCRRCGICLGSCPERVISFADYSINLVSSMIKSVEVPDEFEEKPRVLVFMCENDALPALQLAARNGREINPYIRIIPVRCLGSINNVWISDALSHGFDGILMIGCKPGDDYQCHFITGSELNEERGEKMEETLNSMMLEPERVRTVFVEITDDEGIIREIDEYMEEIELVGPNPFKDM